jgi:hypothetical protein
MTSGLAWLATDGVAREEAVVDMGLRGSKVWRAVRARRVLRIGRPMLGVRILAVSRDPDEEYRETAKSAVGRVGGEPAALARSIASRAGK